MRKTNLKPKYKNIFSSREIFAQALLELSKKYKVNKISVKKITEECGLSRQTFYNLFEDKEELILWIQQSESDRMMKKLEDSKYSYDALVKENIRFYVDHKDFMQNVIENPQNGKSYLSQSAENAFNVWYNYIEQHSGKKVLTKEVVFDLKLYCHAAVIMLADWALNMDDISENLFAKYLKNAMPEKLRDILK